MAQPYVHANPLGTGPPSPPRGIVIVDPRFCLPNPVGMEIMLKFSDRRSMMPRDFVITGVDGNLLFKVEEPYFRLTGKKILLDDSGSPVLTLKPTNPVFSLTWKVFRGASTEQRDLLFTVKKSIWRLDVFLGHNEEEKRCDFRVQASSTKRSCVIYAGQSKSDAIVAQMDQKHTAMSLLLGRDNISVEVFPNVDYAFIASLVVMLDDMLWTPLDKLRFAGVFYYKLGSLIFNQFDLLSSLANL